MTIRSIIDLLAQADSTLPDNSTQLITAAVVRNIIKDFLDTVSPAYGAIRCSSTVETLAGATPITLAPFTTTDAATVGYYTANLTNGSVTRTLNATGVTDFILASGSVDGPNNDLVTVSLFRDGAATGYSATVVLGGVGNPAAFNIAALLYSTTAPVYTLVATGPAGSKTFTNLSIVAQAQPVRSFV